MPNVDHIDRAIAKLAAAQDGVVARRQLEELGLRHGAIDHRVRCGRLHPVHRGVYSIAPRPIGRARWMAAVLASGPDALLSHRSAGAALGVRPTPRCPIEVTVPHGRGRGPKGVLLHRARNLHADDRTVHDGIPVTSLPRTLLDLADVLTPAQLSRALEEAERLRLLDV